MDRLLHLMVDFNAARRSSSGEKRCAPLLHLLTEPILGRVWLMHTGGSLVGYGVLTFGYDLEFLGGDAFLTEVYLLPYARGRGLGRRVLAAIELEATTLGVQAIHLGVRPENARALALYRASGYQAPPRIIVSKRLATARPCDDSRQ